jgi:hypothetical protein
MTLLDPPIIDDELELQLMTLLDPPIIDDELELQII